MFCYNCGSKIMDDDMFCENCGAQIQQMPVKTISEQEIVEETITTQVILEETKNETSLMWLVPMAAFLMCFIFWLIDSLFFWTGPITFGLVLLVGSAVVGEICFSKFKDEDKRGIVRFFKIVGVIAKVSIFIGAGFIQYGEFKEKKVLDISSVNENDLEDGMYATGTIYKVMSKVGEYDGKTYYTVMLPSTDMTDWETVNDKFEMFIGLYFDQLPRTDVEMEERRVVTVSTDDPEKIKIFDQMVNDNEHWIKSKLFSEPTQYKGNFEIKVLSDKELINAFQEAAIGQDSMDEWQKGVEQGNLCYYELEEVDHIPFFLNQTRNYTWAIFWTIILYIGWKILYRIIGYIKGKVIVVKV